MNRGLSGLRDLCGRFCILHPARHRRDETVHADSAVRGACRRDSIARPKQIVKLDANENPYGPSPKAREALANAAFLNIYPDPDNTFLREALAKFTGMPKERLFPGAGADELIDLVLRATITPGDVVINCPPSFGMYPFSADVNAAQLIEVPRRADFSPRCACDRIGGPIEPARESALRLFAQ